MTRNSIDHEQIKTELSAKNITFTDIAIAKNVTASHVIRVANRKTNSLPVAKAICLGLNKPLEDVFGDVEPYFTPAKRGRPDRTVRTAQVVDAIKRGLPVPDVQQQVYA